MYIMYLGYLSAFVVVLIGFAFWNLPSHPHPAMGALAFFILLPSMVVAISIEVLVAIPARDKTIVADNFRKRLVGRPRAFLIGFTVGLGGASTVLAVLAVAYSLEFSGFLAIGCFFFVFIIVSLSPAIGAIWLLKVCRRFETVHTNGKECGMQKP